MKIRIYAAPAVGVKQLNLLNLSVKTTDRTYIKSCGLFSYFPSFSNRSLPYIDILITINDFVMTVRDVIIHIYACFIFLQTLSLNNNYYCTRVWDWSNNKPALHRHLKSAQYILVTMQSLRRLSRAWRTTRGCI